MFDISGEILILDPNCRVLAVQSTRILWSVPIRITQVELTNCGCHRCDIDVGIYDGWIISASRIALVSFQRSHTAGIWDHLELLLTVPDPHVSVSGCSFP